jgi:hypothetical protein
MPSAFALNKTLQMEFTQMTNRIIEDRIPATADATMLYILTYGFSANPRHRKPAKRTAQKRASDISIAEAPRGVLTLKKVGARPATVTANSVLAASIGGAPSVRRSKRLIVMRNVEVVHVRTIRGAQRVVKREVHQVECKRKRTN